MSARDRLAELAADETAAVYAAPRGAPDRTAQIERRAAAELRALDEVAAPYRREALVAASTQTGDPRRRPSTRARVPADHDHGHVLDFPAHLTA